MDPNKWYFPNSDDAEIMSTWNAQGLRSLATNEGRPLNRSLHTKRRSCSPPPWRGVSLGVASRPQSSSVASTTSVVMCHVVARNTHNQVPNVTVFVDMIQVMHDQTSIEACIALLVPPTSVEEHRHADKPRDNDTFETSRSTRPVHDQSPSMIGRATMHLDPCCCGQRIAMPQREFETIRCAPSVKHIWLFYSHPQLTREFANCFSITK